MAETLKAALLLRDGVVDEGLVYAPALRHRSAGAAAILNDLVTLTVMAAVLMALAAGAFRWQKD